MFNVLPNFLKREIKNQYHLRFWIVVLISVLFIQISFLILLFPSWIISTYRESELTNQVNLSLSSKKTDSLFQSVKSTNQKLGIINTVFNYKDVLPLVNEIISYKSKSISLQDFTYIAAGASGATISIQGISLTREALVLFIKDLQKSTLFSEVNSPVSNLAKDKNISFLITLNIKQ